MRKLYHPVLDVTIERTPRQAEVLTASGWEDISPDPPIPDPPVLQSDETSTQPPPAEADPQQEE